MKKNKEWKALNIKLDKRIYDGLVKYCEITGQSKTVAVERILDKAFKDLYKSQTNR